MRPAFLPWKEDFLHYHVNKMNVGGKRAIFSIYTEAFFLKKSKKREV